MSNNKKILFLTTHNLATNPRLVKELELALANGYEVELICFEFDNWSHSLNQQLKEKFTQVSIHILQGGRKPLIPWLKNAITETIYRYAGKMMTLSIPALSQAVSRRSDMIIAALQTVKKADLVIGHNPGALYPALVAAKKFVCIAGFDVEDYHPGEGRNGHMQKLAKTLLRKGLPQFNYVSFASPLIMKQVEKDLSKPIVNGFTILNFFKQSEFETPMGLLHGPLKLVWFSQNISFERGLELVIPTIKRYNRAVELHLIGNLAANFKAYIDDAPNITIHPPMSQLALHRSLINYDIGLALEPAKDLNNRLAISNKLLASLQAGLYVVATDTAAQKNYLDQLPAHGECFSYKENKFEKTLIALLNRVDQLRENRQNRYQQFKQNNWEQAGISALNIWKYWLDYKL